MCYLTENNVTYKNKAHLKNSREPGHPSCHYNINRWMMEIIIRILFVWYH